MTKIDFFFNRKSGQNDQNWGPGMGLWVLSRSSSPKAAHKGPSCSLLPGPSKGSKMVKIGSNLGSPEGPSKVPSWSKGTNRAHFGQGQNLGSGGLKMGQNRVKMAFSLTLIGKMTKLTFFNRKSGQNDQNWRSWAWVCEVLSRSFSPKAAS